MPPGRTNNNSESSGLLTPCESLLVSGRVKADVQAQRQHTLDRARKVEDEGTDMPLGSRCHRCKSKNLRCIVPNDPAIRSGKCSGCILKPAPCSLVDKERGQGAQGAQVASQSDGTPTGPQSPSQPLQRRLGNRKRRRTGSASLPSRRIRHHKDASPDDAYQTSGEGSDYLGEGDENQQEGSGRGRIDTIVVQSRVHPPVPAPTPSATGKPPGAQILQGYLSPADPSSGSGIPESATVTEGRNKLNGTLAGETDTNPDGCEIEANSEDGTGGSIPSQGGNNSGGLQGQPAGSDSPCQSLSRDDALASLPSLRLLADNTSATSSTRAEPQHCTLPQSPQPIRASRPSGGEPDNPTTVQVTSAQPASAQTTPAQSTSAKQTRLPRLDQLQNKLEAAEGKIYLLETRIRQLESSSESLTNANDALHTQVDTTFRSLTEENRALRKLVFDGERRIAEMDIRIMALERRGT